MPKALYTAKKCQENPIFLPNKLTAILNIAVPNRDTKKFLKAIQSNGERKHTFRVILINETTGHWMKKGLDKVNMQL